MFEGQVLAVVLILFLFACNLILVAGIYDLIDGGDQDKDIESPVGAVVVGSLIDLIVIIVYLKISKDNGRRV